MAIYDVMILFLGTPLSMRCPASFVKLPLVNADTPSNMLNKPLMVVGWGSTLPVSHQQFWNWVYNIPNDIHMKCSTPIYIMFLKVFVN